MISFKKPLNAIFYLYHKIEFAYKKKEKSTYESPTQSWNLMVPSVVSAVKFGNTSPKLSAGILSDLVLPTLSTNTQMELQVSEFIFVPWEHSTAFFF